MVGLPIPTPVSPVATVLQAARIARQGPRSWRDGTKGGAKVKARLRLKPKQKLRSYISQGANARGTIVLTIIGPAMSFLTILRRGVPNDALSQFREPERPKLPPQGS